MGPVAISPTKTLWGKCTSLVGLVFSAKFWVGALTVNKSNTAVMELASYHRSGA